MTHIVKITRKGCEDLKNQLAKRVQAGNADALRDAGLEFDNPSKSAQTEMIPDKDGSGKMEPIHRPIGWVNIYYKGPLLKAAVEAAKTDPTSSAWIEKGPNSGRGQSPRINFKFAGFDFRILDGAIQSSISKHQ